MKTLVTGGAGFIGSHLVDALVARGDEVLVIDDLSTGKPENLTGALERGASLEELDVREATALNAAAERFRPAAVFHLAAQIDVRKSMADPAYDARLNVLGTLNALEAATGADRFIFTSTGGALYGEGAERPGALPFPESAPCEPLSVYGQSKLAAEGYVGLYRRWRGLSAMTLRLANVYGPRQDPANEAGVVAIFCAAARNGARPTVFGDGRQTRDYLYVGDVVEALLAAQAGDAAGPLNVGTGVETSVLELAAAVGRAAGREDFEPEFAEPRQGEVERSALDPSAAAAELGWAPGTALDAGLGRTLEHL